MPETDLGLRRLPVAAILERWRAALPPLRTVELPLAEAVGTILAEPVTAPTALPAVAFALVDGQAVISAETFGASPYAPTDLSQTLAVTAGAAVPPPFDAVAAADEATSTAAEVPVAPGANLRRVGDDATAGALLLAAGTRLTSRGRALAAAAGVASVTVRRGHAVLAVDADPTGEPIATLLADFLAAHGFVPTLVGLADAVEAADGSDLVVLLGDRAIGAADPARRAIATAPGWRPIGRPALRPGETTIVGALGSSPTLVIPARLDDCLAVAVALLAPLLATWTGSAPIERSERRPLARKLVSTIGFSELTALVASPDGAVWEPLGSGAVGAAGLSRATHWALLPPESEGIDATTPVPARPWPEGL